MVQTVATLVRLAVGVAVGVAFVVAAVAKLRDRAGFTRTLVKAPVTRAGAGWLSMAVPAAELVLAAGLVAPWPRRVAAVAAVAAVGLLGVFTAFLASTPQLDAAGGCRCFGSPGASRTSGTVRNLVLVAVLLGTARSWPEAGAAAAACCAGFVGYLAIARRAGETGTTLRAEHGELMLVFVEAGCGPCHDLLAEIPTWPTADGVELRVLGLGDLGPSVLAVPEQVFDAYGITATPSAVVVDTGGRPVDGNHRAGAEPAVGPQAVVRRWRVAVQGHDLPLPPDAERTLLLFVDRDDEVPDAGQDAAAVVVLTPRRLRRPPANLQVRLDPGGAIRALFDVKHTPAAVLVDRRGTPLAPVHDGVTGVATLLQPPRP